MKIIRLSRAGVGLLFLINYSCIDESKIQDPRVTDLIKRVHGLERKSTGQKLESTSHVSFPITNTDDLKLQLEKVSEQYDSLREDHDSLKSLVYAQNAYSESLFKDADTNTKNIIIILRKLFKSYSGIPSQKDFDDVIEKMKKMSKKQIEELAKKERIKVDDIMSF